LFGEGVAACTRRLILKSERAPLAGRPVSQNSFPCTDITTEAASAYQAPSLVEGSDILFGPSLRN
jgi:hypothetical protein